MKAFGLLFIASLTAFSATSHAATLSASALQCGGYASVEVEGNSYIIQVQKLSKSTCDTVEIKSLNFSARIPNSGLRQAVDPRALGNQLVLLVNNSEVVILNTAQKSAAGQANTNGMSDYERSRLQIEQERAAREKAQQNAEAAAAAAEAGVELGGAVVDGVGGLER